jgi:hypothetical protein
MLNIPGWSQDNNIIITELINGYDILDAPQKQAFHDLVGPDASPHIETLILSNRELSATADPSHCVNELLTIIARRTSVAPMPFPFLHLFCQSQLMKGIKALDSAGLLTVEAIRTMTKRPKTDQLGDILSILQGFSLLSPEHCTIILSEITPTANSRQPSEYIAKSLGILLKKKMANVANIQKLMQCDPHKSCIAIDCLDRLGWFTPLFGQANFETMIKPDMINKLSYLIHIMNSKSATNKIWSNTENVLRSKKREHLFPLLERINEADFLNQEIIDLLLKCSTVEFVLEIFDKTPTDLLTEENCKKILHWIKLAHEAAYTPQSLSPYFTKSIQFLECLQLAGLFTHSVAQTNFNAFFNYLSSQIDPDRTKWQGCKIMDQLIAINIFNGSHHQQKFEILMKTSPSVVQITDTILLLENIGLLETDLALFHSLQHPLSYAQALEILVKSNCFNETFRQKFYNHMIKAGSPCSYAEAYCTLSKENLYFNETKRKKVTFNDIKSCSDPSAVVKILQHLATHEMLTNDNLKIIKEKKIDTQLWTAINHIQQSSIPLTHIDLKILLQAHRPSPEIIATILVKLKEAGMPINDVNQNYLARILNHIDPLDVTDAILCLKQLTLDEEAYQFYQDAVFNRGTGIIKLSSDPRFMPPDELSALIRCKRAYALFKGNIYSIRDDSSIITVEHHTLTPNDLMNCTKLFQIKKNTACAISNENLNIIQTATNQTKADNSCLSFAQTIAILHDEQILTAKFRLQYLRQVLTHTSPVALAQAIVIIQLNATVYSTEILLEAMIAHPEPLELIHAITHLLVNSIDGPYLNTLIASSQPLKLAEGMVALNQKDLLTDHYMQHHFIHLANHPTPLLYANALLILHHANLLDGVLNDPQFNQNFETMNKNAETYARTIVFFNRHDLLKSKITRRQGHLTSYFSSMVKNIEANHLLNILEVFESIDMKGFKIDGPLVQATLSCLYPEQIHKMLPQIIKLATHIDSTHYCKTILITLLKHTDPQRAMVNCHYLHKNNLLKIDSIETTMHIVSCHSNEIFTLTKYSKLTQAYLNQLQLSPIYCDALNIFDKLSTKIDNPASYLPIMMADRYPRDFIKSIHCLQTAGLITSANVELLKHRQHADSWLQKMLNTGLLNQLSFDRLMHYFSILGEIFHILYRIPEHKFTHLVFSQIITICQTNNENPNTAIRMISDYIQHTVLEIPRGFHPRHGAIELNTKQSTHTTSVHQSVSASAAKLWQRYREKIEHEINESIIKINDYITHLPETPENLIAQRCWLRLKTQRFLLFRDVVSNVTTAQLIVLFWSAIHDLDARIYNKIDPEATVLAEGRALFVQALYELQRDGNINEHDIDDGDKKDKGPSCCSGTFNKFIEKLNTVHPDVELIVITREGASNRLQILVRKLCFERMIERINVAKDNGETLDPATIDNAIEQLWPEIQTSVSDLIFTEFCSIFKHDKENVGFITLLEAGSEVSFTAEQVQTLKELNTLVAAGKKHPRDEDEDEQQHSSRVRLGLFAPPQQNDQDDNLSSASIEQEGPVFGK